VAPRVALKRRKPMCTVIESTTEPIMAEPIGNSLVYEVLKDVQARLATLEGMRDEMREGFASLRAHVAIQRTAMRSSSNAAYSSPPRPIREEDGSASCEDVACWLA
jgi:hypothetical protein